MANEAKKERILVLNLGSTSSKIAVYDDTEEVRRAVDARSPAAKSRGSEH